tara:strand:+ start:1084 stop:1482 length:399 start_codon:yes stop_codon:yes gene_type:complete
VELEKRKFSRVLCSLDGRLKKKKTKFEKFRGRIFFASGDKRHNARRARDTTHRREKRTHDVFKLTRGNTRKKRRLDRSQHRNSDRKRRARYDFEAEREEESFETRLATTGKLSGKRGGERVTGDEVREHAIY